MSLIAFIVVGLIAGWLAGLIMRGHGLGIIADIVVGIIGALIGGYLFALLGVTTDSFIGWVLTALVGAIILLFIINLISGRGRGRAVRH